MAKAQPDEPAASKAPYRISKKRERVKEPPVAPSQGGAAAAEGSAHLHLLPMAL